MPLQQSYEVQTEIPAGLQEHYVERDGKWWLQADPPIEDVTGLKTALTTERNLRRESEKSFSDIKMKFEGIEPDEFHKLKARVKGLDEAEIYDKEGIEEVIRRRTESMKADHTRIVDNKDREIVQLRGKVEESDHRWRQDRIKTALISAISGSGVDKDALQDGVSRGLTVFTDLDDEGNVIARNGQDIVYGKDGINALSPTEWITQLKASGTARHLWPPSSGGGAPVYHGSNGPVIDWDKLPPTERRTLFREQQSRTR